MSTCTYVWLYMQYAWLLEATFSVYQKSELRSLFNIIKSSMRLIHVYFTVKSVIKYHTRQNSPVYTCTCFLDASKAFDRITHWTLLRN